MQLFSQCGRGNHFRLNSTKVGQVFSAIWLHLVCSVLSMALQMCSLRSGMYKLMLPKLKINGCIAIKRLKIAYFIHNVSIGLDHAYGPLPEAILVCGP